MKYRPYFSHIASLQHVFQQVLKTSSNSHVNQFLSANSKSSTCQPISNHRRVIQFQIIESLVMPAASAKLSTREVSTFENSFQDNGSNFGMYQLWFFLLSVVGLTLYFVHYLGSVFVSIRNLNEPYDATVYAFPLVHRTTLDALLELFILLGRWGNELYFGKWTASDIVHHAGVVLGIYLAFFNEECMPFAWLVCQLNALHYPMFLWYFGCRKNCFSKSLSTQNLCKSVFPPLWLFVSSYRLSCLLFATFWAWWGEDNTTAALCGLLFGAILGYLDKNWTAFFFQDLQYYSNSSKSRKSMTRRILAWDLVVISLIYGIGIAFGFMTVFWF